MELIEKLPILNMIVKLYNISKNDKTKQYKIVTYSVAYQEQYIRSELASQ